MPRRTRVPSSSYWLLDILSYLYSNAHDFTFRKYIPFDYAVSHVRDPRIPCADATRAKCELFARFDDAALRDHICGLILASSPHVSKVNTPDMALHIHMQCNDAECDMIRNFLRVSG